ncbi:unnamed protein product (macronuclear) [Paramecium tetraurelia]|uniref:Uncharacterized protein n=1 Tax=Paramecium tetraurelia TaxID=5888 RepID=A0C265_PARTE|nr:uncharacterized protein GSPATT00034359001 [Paramecium tetraurelia]CAK64882.1 unnamed protein product [Paramecium tetraurelia]|eukprot:XP_001432279.1 hypothetical protein (macronuclear) [Paramecium tetraurelia strain d4-2]
MESINLTQICNVLIIGKLLITIVSQKMIPYFGLEKQKLKKGKLYSEIKQRYSPFYFTVQYSKNEFISVIATAQFGLTHFINPVK